VCNVASDLGATAAFISDHGTAMGWDDFDEAAKKLNAKLADAGDPERKIKGVTSAFNILEKFGTVVYIVDGKTYKIKGKLVNIPAKKKKVANHFYIEVNERILKADYAYVLIKVRNKEYKYIIKNNEEEK
jgi:hypothetical protein